MDTYELPGVAVGIVAGGQTIYARGFGVRRIGNSGPVSTRSVFHLASLSKVFVATAIMQLVEQNQVALEAKLVEYLPYFRMAGPGYEGITIRQILSHTSGIPDLTDYEWNAPQYDDGAAERYARSLGDLAPAAAPGEVFLYCNRAYNLLAEVIRRTSGLPFETYMRRYLFDPLEMPHSTFTPREVPPKLATCPHTLGKDFRSRVSSVYPYNRVHAPSSTLHSSIDEMLHWIEANLNGGNFRGRSIVQPAAHALLWQPQVVREGETSMCLGWKKVQKHGFTFFTSLGADPGFRAFLILLPEKKLAAIVAVNSDTLSAEAVVVPLLQSVLDFPVTLPKKPIYFPLGKTIADQGIEAAVSQYYALREHAPDQYDFQETHLLDLGYRLLYRMKGKAKHAVRVFQLGTEAYPDSWLAHNGLAQAYARAGEKERAIAGYRRALALNVNNQPAIRALKQLDPVVGACR